MRVGVLVRIVNSITNIARNEYTTQSPSSTDTYVTKGVREIGARDVHVAVIPKASKLHISLRISAAALGGSKHIISSRVVDRCTSKARSEYRRPGSIVTNTNVGTATTTASALVITELRITDTEHSAIPHNKRVTAGSRARECCSIRENNTNTNRNDTEAHTQPHKIQPAAECTARIPGIVESESSCPPAASLRNAPAITAAGRLI